MLLSVIKNNLKIFSINGYATIVCNVAIISGEKKINNTCDLIDCLICLSVIPTFLMISKFPLSSYPSEICL